MAKKNLKDVQPIELTLEKNKPMASSLQVAKHFGKQHNNVLRDIRNITKDVPSDWFTVNFEPINNITDLGHAERQDPAYMMTRDGFAFLSMGFTGKKAAKWKIDYLNAFNAMEKALSQGQRKSALSELPEESEEQRTDRMRIVIKALIKFWVASDNISTDIATRTVCSSLNIISLDEFKINHFSQAWHFIFRTIALPSVAGDEHEIDTKSEEKIFEAAAEMMKAVMQFKICRTINVQRIFHDSCSINLETFTRADLSKLLTIIWGIFQFWAGYSIATIKADKLS